MKFSDLLYIFFIPLVSLFFVCFIVYCVIFVNWYVALFVCCISAGVVWCSIQYVLKRIYNRN